MSPQEMKAQKLKQTYSAVLTLMAKKPLADVTVAELCRLAQVSRTYYYRNFASMQDIVEQYQTANMMAYLRKLPGAGRLPFVDLMTYYFELVRETAPETRLVIASGLTNTLEHTFRTVFVYLGRTSVVEIGASPILRNRYYASFIAGGVVAAEVQWLQTGMEATPRQMAETLRDFLRIQD